MAPVQALAPATVPPIDAYATVTVPSLRRALRRAAPALASVAAVCGLLALAGIGLPWQVTGALALAWVLLAFRHRTDVDLGTRARLRDAMGDGTAVAAVAWCVPLLSVDLVPRTLLGGVGHQALAAHLAGLVLATFALAEVRARAGSRRDAPLIVAGHPDDVVEALPELGDRWRVEAVLLTEPARPHHRMTLARIVVHDSLAAAPEVLAASPSCTLLALPGPGLAPEAVRRLSWIAGGTGTEVHVATSLVGVRSRRCTAADLGRISTVRVAHPPLAGPARSVKSALERVAAGLGLLALSPALLLVAAMIRRDSPGPALFRQTRVGRGGEPFTMLKFRTMRCGADGDKAALATQNEGSGVLFKIHDDPRITPLGRVLRKYSVDELPQLWNVVRGEMSLVGPRPALPDEVAAYAPDPHRRLAVKPGLTGLWQVSGRSDLSWEESTRLDLDYVDHWSLAGDAVIVARTAGAVIGHRGAY